MKNPVDYVIDAYRPRDSRTGATGVGELADELGVYPKTIRRWREKGWIPAERLADVMAGAKRRGIRLDVARCVPLVRRG